MYITSSAEEFVHEDAPASTGSGQDINSPASVDSTDVLKTGLLYTKTPDTIAKGPNGRQRLLVFLDKVEQNIAKEVASRRADITAIRVQMNKNMEFNQNARKKMKKMLLAKMAINAKKSKDDLNAAMRDVQKKFAEASALENKRNTETIERSKKTRAIMRKNKAEGAKDLKMAVAAQQRALDTLAKATNARIAQTNKHIHQNAADIKANAKKARQDLDHAMSAFDNKMANVKEEASKGRSKLAQQAADQDKKFREDANNKIKEIAMKTAAEFKAVREKMATDRSNADAAVAAMSAQMKASLQAQKTLQDKRFSQTVSDIATAKKEADDRVNGFKTSFKASILSLAGTVETQSKKLNSRMNQLSATVTNNRIEQAHVNAQVHAELKRIQKIGDDRYNEHIKKDAELHALMQKNAEETAGEMLDMSTRFFADIEHIKEQMKKDRAHAENALASSTSKLFETIQKNIDAQAAVNKELTDATREAKLTAAQNLHDAKQEFATKIGSLTTTVNDLAKKQGKKIEKLTGIVRQNALKDAQGREDLKKISKDNKNTIESAIHDAIQKGEQRALQVEAKMKDINDKTRSQLSNRISTEIGHLRKQIHGQITDLTLQTKEARAEMKEEIMFAIKSAEAVAKKNLVDMVQWSEGEFSKLHQLHEQGQTTGAEGRAALKDQIDADKKSIEEKLTDAVMAQNEALLAERYTMCQEVGVLSGVIDDHGKHVATPEAVEQYHCGGGKLNKKADNAYEEMMYNAQEVGAKITENGVALVASLDAAKSEADSGLNAANKASIDRYDATIESVKTSIQAAADKSNKRFTAHTVQMAKDALEVGENLAAAVKKLNDDIAKAAALEDERFSKTVTDIKAAKAAARADVEAAKKAMTSDMVLAEAKLTASSEAIEDMVFFTSEALEGEAEKQRKVNKQVKEAIDGLLKKTNDDHSEDKRARGVLRGVMNQYKIIAHNEVVSLRTEAESAISKTKDKQAEYLAGFKEDVSKASGKLVKAINDWEAEQAEAMGTMRDDLKAKTAAVQQKLKTAEELFGSRVTTLTNAITANAKSFERNLEEKTGIVLRWKEADAADRAAIRSVRAAMVSDLEAQIANAIKLGEARMAKVLHEAEANIKTEKKSLLSTIAIQVENMADNVFVAVQENRAQLADNYLSLKAYAQAAADAVEDYLKKGKGRNLSSVGDLLYTLSQTAGVETPAAEGEGFGADTIPTIFSGEEVAVDGSISKINGLVNEYVKTLGGVKDRWPMGLGYYLISRLELAMQKQGALEVDKIEGKAGNYVFVNAHSVGLSSKLPDFESLAVKMTVYEAALSHLTQTLPNTPTAGKKQELRVPAPEWEGN